MPWTSPSLRLPIRSISRCSSCKLDHSIGILRVILCTKIIVVDNSVDTPLDRAVLMPLCGDLPVRIIDATTLAPRPNNSNGWFTQQVYKLLVARDVSTKNYLVLDAKNHLIAPLTQPMLQAPDGRLRIEQHNFVNHPLKPHLLRACDYFGVDHHVIHAFVPLGTPFGMPTDLVRDLVIHVERNDQPLMQSFLAARVTDFSFFGTYVLHLGHQFEDHYQWCLPIGDVLWFGHDNARMQQTISQASQGCCFGVHRWTFHNMDATTQHMVASLWYERNLFASYDDGRRFIRDCAVAYRADWLSVKHWLGS